MSAFMNIPSINTKYLPLDNALSGRSLFSKQQGAVLILALLIVALVTGLGIKFAGDYQLGLARAEGRWNGAQARAYSFSAEGAAVKILSQDATAYDSLDEAWAQEMPIEVDGGTLLIGVKPANSQFNLNSLLDAAKPLDPNLSPMDPTRYSSTQRMFIRLLQLFPEMVRGPDEAAGILEAVVDWMDSDDNTSGSTGAETSYYLGLPDPYMPANVGFRSIEELQLVRGITPDLMRALRPYITVINSDSGMNSNTVDPLIYRCINISSDLKPLDEAVASKLQPQMGPYKDKAEFDAAVSKLLNAAGGLDIEIFSVSTNFFWLQTQADIGEQRRTARSLIKREQPLFKVVRREEVY